MISKYSIFGALALIPAIGMADGKQPNVVVFIVDDMGLMDTSVPFITDADGHPVRQPLNDWYHTPSMEQLARQGVRFSTFYAQSVSSPSRTSLLTGQNAARHRTTNWINPGSNNRDEFGPHLWNWNGLTASVPVYPALLREAGYRTIHVGKAHFGPNGSEGENPCRLGFDVNIGGSAIGHPGSYLGEEGYGAIKGQRSHAVPGLKAYHGTETFLTDALTKEACREVKKAVDEGRPFYLNMAHYAVHAPFYTDKRFIQRYANGKRPKNAQAFATLIEGMDKSLGELMRTLEEAGVAENTLILFVGDNGSDAPLGGAADHGSSAPLRGKKGSEYEGGMRVPFIAAWAKPDADNALQREFPIVQGGVQKQMGTIMDIYPTILAVTGVKPVEHYPLDGGSLWKLLSGKADGTHRDDFLMHFPHAHRGSYFTVYRKGDWKLIYYYHPEKGGAPDYRLYNLNSDPYETTDLASENPERVRKMLRMMKKRLTYEQALYPVSKEGKELVP